MNPRLTWLVLCLFCACASRQSAVYRADRDVRDLARALCDEVAFLGSETDASRDVLQCDLAPHVRTSIRINGDVLRVEADSTWRHSDIALKLGVLAQQRGFRIEFKGLQ
ncbi:hypothetical protein LXT21_38495 [Myxococcus sp. K38C18041901]|uniref:hypothetical protein n=1 Tax=Myxococcus guangdongensis TaxID=2906760 RepID=UPI0020A80A32|nr:hypothetical protein [Myxococcus guangdongensis]MCP3064677.1 hypothetical protein [Myxococcus guangdongensis]